MSLAKKYHQKAIQAQKDAEFRAKKTERLAGDRYEHILTLISGAASQGKTCIPYRSGWFPPGDTRLDEFREVYTLLADKLRNDGFFANVKPIARIDGDVHLIIDIDWSNPVPDTEEQNDQETN